ncbi:hypothetical protein [Streptomyces sp. NPDC058653]
MNEVRQRRQEDGGAGCAGGGGFDCWLVGAGRWLLVAFFTPE